jgi:hypothetical protein
VTTFRSSNSKISWKDVRIVNFALKFVMIIESVNLGRSVKNTNLNAKSTAHAFSNQFLSLKEYKLTRSLVLLLLYRGQNSKVKLMRSDGQDWFTVSTWDEHDWPRTHYTAVPSEFVPRNFLFEMIYFWITLEKVLITLRAAN